MAGLSVRSGSTAGISAIGETISLDFSADVDASQNEVILAYAVGLAGFLFNYETDSDFWAENMGLLAVRLVPNLVGNVLRVTASAIMTDYGGSAGQSPAASRTDPSCMVQFTAVALIGTSLQQDMVVGNVYCVPDGDSTSPVTIGDNALEGAFLSGLSMAVSGSPGSLNSFSAGVKAPTNSSQMTMSATASISAGQLNTNSSIDAMLLSLPSSTVTNFQIVQLTFQNWSNNGEGGLSAEFSATFTIPPDYTEVAYVGLLQESVNIIYGGDDEFQVVEAYYPTLSISGSEATGSYLLNMYNPDFGSRTYIADGSNAVVYAIAQFA
jgi:hypothetical protein